MTDFPGFSQDAAIVVALAATAVPRAASPEDEAERWLRALRMNGHVGRALQALGIGDSPLETAAQPEWVRRLHPPGDRDDPVQSVTERAQWYASQRGAALVGTIDVLFAIFEVYGKVFDRALYIRGASREELVERLATIEAMV